MTKRLVDIDDEILEKARRALGTRTLKNTVNEALRASVQAQLRRDITQQSIERFVEATVDLRDPQIMAGAWD